MLEILTVTGVDDETSLDALRKLSDNFPRLEFAVLVGSRTGKGSPRYPALDTVERFREMRVRKAIHLCGQLARQAAAGFASLPIHSAGASPRLIDLVDGFDRVQVNLSPDEWEGRHTFMAASLSHFADAVSAQSVILQHRKGWDTVPVQHPKIEYLFDRSGGAGKPAFAEWPDPPSDRRVGYAGGIGPSNIAMAEHFIDRHPESRVWLDMESQMRYRDRLSLARVRAVCFPLFGCGSDNMHCAHIRGGLSEQCCYCDSPPERTT